MFYRLVLGADYGKSAEERDLRCNVAVRLFVKADGEATQVGIASFCVSAVVVSGTLQSHLQIQPFHHDTSHDLTDICTNLIVNELKSHTYRYSFHTTN